MSETNSSKVTSILTEITWHTIIDQRACPKCISLNGFTFQQDIFQSYLIHPAFGAVWDLNIDQPLTHGGAEHHCRCALEVRGIISYSAFNPTLQEVIGQELENSEVIFPMGTSISEVRGEIDRLTGSLQNASLEMQDLTSHLREFRLIASQLGLPQEVSTVLREVSYARRILGMMDDGGGGGVVGTGGMGMGATVGASGAFGATGVGGAAIGGILTLVLIGMMLQPLIQWSNESRDTAIKEMYARMQQELEAEQMKLRRIRY